MSYPRNPDDANSPNWELVIRLDEDCFLDNDNCGVDVTEKHMELILRKRIDSMKLWEKFFVGLSESSLKVRSEIISCNDILNYNKKGSKLEKKWYFVGVH